MDTLWLVFLALGIKGGFFLLANWIQARGQARTPPFAYAMQRGGKVTPGAKKVVVTGGNGFLGRRVCDMLVEVLGDKVNVFSLDVAPKAGPNRAVTYIRGDVCKATHLELALTRCDCLVHCATMLDGATTRHQDVTTTIEIGTKCVVEVCLEKDVRNLVYTSSVAALLAAGPEPQAPITEASPLPPREELLGGVYAQGKHTCEKLVRALNSHVLKTIIIRPGALFGVDDTTGFTKSLISNSAVPSRAPDSQLPFLWVDDAARLHVAAVQRMLFPGDSAPAADASAAAGVAAVQKVSGRVYHACHDAVRDPCTFRDVCDGRLAAAIASGRAAARASASASASTSASEPGTDGKQQTQKQHAQKRQQQPQQQAEAGTGRSRGPMVLPLWLAMWLAKENEKLGRNVGWAPLGRDLTVASVLFRTRNLACDVSDARELLGWEPTPWAQALAHVGEQHEASLLAARAAKAAASKQAKASRAAAKAAGGSAKDGEDKKTK